MQQLLKTLTKCLAVLLMMTVIGFALIAVSYAFPDKTIIYNASVSTDFLVSEYVSKDMEWMNWPDYYTDMVMLNIASYSEGNNSCIQRAAENEKLGHTEEGSYPFEIVQWLSERTPVTKTWYTYNEATASNEPCSYGKYWNGYLIFLRPLLLYFNMRQIYGFFRTAMTLLFIAAVIVLLIRNWRMAPPFILAFLTLRPYSKFCLTYAILEMLTCVFVCVCALDGGLKRSSEKRKVFFFIMGAVHQYFTLMSFSFVAPLLCAVYLAYSTEDSERRRTSGAEMIVTLVFWYGLGYGCMWVMKWIILAFADISLLTEVIESVKQRSSHSDYGEEITLWETLLWNMCGFYYKNRALQWCACTAVGEAVLLAVLFAVKKKCPVTFRDCSVLVTVLLVIAARYAVTMNHSKVHYFFMNRLLCGAVFVILAVGLTAISRSFGDMLADRKQTKATN